MSAVFLYLICLIIFICCFIILNKIIKTYNYHKVMNKIPKPSNSFSMWRNVFYLSTKPDDVFDLIRKFSKDNYPIYRLSNIFGVVVALLDPNDIEQVLTSTKHLEKSRLYNFLHNWLGTGLLTSFGTKWQKRRKIITPAFHFSILKKFIDVFNEETEKLIKYLECHEMDNIDLLGCISYFTLDIITETAMGLQKTDKTDQVRYKNAIYKIGKIYLERLLNPLYLIKCIYNLSNLSRKENEQVKVLHEFTNNIILTKKHEYDLTKKRFLDILLKAKEDGEELDDEGIREEVNTFMFEGHDTTAMAISYILFCLAQHKIIQERIFNEISEVLSDEKPTFTNIQDLKYTEMCIKECLRLYPSVPFITRMAGETFVTTTGYTILKGTVIHLHIFDIHRNAKYFPDPLTFDPDRFLPQNLEKRHPFAYIPFSAGPRNCIGQRFALLEIKVALCGILRKFALEPAGSAELRFRPDLVLRPLTNLHIKVVKREY